MAKFRVRVSHKGKRWKKGHSSSSNPETNKHREAAQSKFFKEIIDGSNLTKEAVEKHDAFTASKTDKIDVDEETETFTLGGGKTFKTFNTFASDWSSCSNKSFNKLLMNFRSDSAMHKEMLAVLAAVTEVIKANNGQETSAEYFAALMTSLEAQDNDDSSVLAILNLLGMGIKSVPESVLQLKFSEASRILLDLLAKYAQSDHTAILRPLVGCLSVLLRVQEAAVWNEPSTIKVLDSLLAFITFSKPKIRKAAQHGIIVVVQASKINNNGMAHIAKHCIQLVEGVTSGGVTTTLHILTLLKDILFAFPKKEMKACCEAILKVMTMNNVLMSSCGMEALHGMFARRPSVNCLPPQRNARLITALYDYQPSPTDVQPTQAWLAVMLEAYLNLAKTEIGLCMANLPRFFTSVTELYLNEKPECLPSITNSMEAALSECLGVAAVPEVVGQHKAEIAKVVNILHSRLSYQYHFAWRHIIHLMSVLFKVCGTTCSKMVLPVLKHLGELRESNQFSYVNEIENTIGSAVRNMGPELVLQAIPFQVNVGVKDRDFKRSWLLPVLKDNIKASTLCFFTEYFLPLATVCRKEAERLKAENDQIGALSYDLLLSQIWALLPSFATQPSDITKSFPIIAKALGGVLNTRKDLRSPVMACLRKLITYCVENNLEEDKNTMSIFSKNYLPILLNIYTTPTEGTDEKGTRLAAYETIKVYLKISDETLCAELFDRALKKLEETDEKDLLTKESVLDLLRALLQYQKVSDIEKLYALIEENVSTADGQRLQKKFYRLLEEICTSESSGCQKFKSKNLNKIKDLLITSLSNAAVRSKGARLKCLLELISKCENPGTLVESIVPEAVLCVKDVNTKCRETAYKILTAMSQFIECDKYIELIMAGLSGNQNVMACSILALATVVYSYKDLIPANVEENILYNIGILALCASREVVGASLCFMKVYIQTFSKDKIAQYIPKLVEVLSKMNEDCKRHFRTNVRDILARLVRWYGVDNVLRLVPNSDIVLKNRLRNLGKLHSRKKKLQEERKQLKSENPKDIYNIKGRPKSIEEILAESDSDMEGVEEDNGKPDKRLKNKAWITETSDDIVDFTDTSAAKKITVSNPASATLGLKNKKDKSKNQFKTASDGRLIIADESDSDEEVGKKKKSIIPGLDDSEDDYENSDFDEEVPKESISGRKRTMSISSAGTSGPPMKYQAGGSGIHRPITKLMAKGKKKATSSVETSGAVYKATKSRGDMKKKGLPDPYAYIPLKKDVLNKRKKMKHIGQFKNIVRSAQKGAKTGMKQKLKKKMKK